MNISMAPITSKGMMNAVEAHSNKEVIHGSNHIKPLFRHLPISRQILLPHIRGTPRVNCASPWDRSWEVGSCFAHFDLSQQKQPSHTKGIRLWPFD